MTTEVQTQTTTCSSCGATLAGGTPLCATCGAVQRPVAGVNYFQAFSLPRKLALDVKSLEREFYRLSRKLHPDLFARKSAEQQQWSLEQTSLVNDAYRTLKNPLTRTEYLLKLEGIELADERSADAAPAKAKIPPELLDEVFELNMQLEEMRMNQKMGDDDPQLRADLVKAKTQFEGELSAIDATLEAEWAKWDAAVDANDEPAQGRGKSAMAALLDKRRYVRNLVRDVNEALA